MTAQVCVIGLGAMGSAAAYHASGRSSVVGIDRHPRGHDRGSSGGRSRIIRLSYFEHPGYVPLLRRAWDLWGELERASASRLLHLTGGLYVSPPGGALVAGARRSAAEHGLAHEVLDASAARERAPGLRVPDGWTGLHEDRAGWLDPDAAIRAHLDLAERNGATLRFSERVLGWAPDGAGVRVRTDAGDLLADRLIVAGGAWMPQLVPALAPLLRVERVPLLWFDPIGPLGPLPVWLCETPEDGTWYGFPADGHGLKVARHGSGEAADPDALDRAARPEDEARARRFLRRYLPAGDGPLRSTHVCMYTLTPDEHFIIDRLDDRVVIASPCSGHGFKFSSAIGLAVAQLALDGRTALPVAFLSRARFA